MGSTSAESELPAIEALGRRLLSGLALELPYAERSPAPAGTPAAVLVLFAFSSDRAASGSTLSRDAAPSVLVIRRVDSEGMPHAGQMAFPGGVCEPHERAGDGGYVEAALRETGEEVGIPASLVRVLGTLPEFSTITGFRVHPVVGILTVPLEEAPLRLSPGEIAEALWIPLGTLTHPETYRREHGQVGPVRFPIHVYQVGEHRIWGATASILKNLLDRLAALG